MKKSKLLAIISAALMIIPVFAKDVKTSFSLTTDFAYKPATAFVAGPTHFAPITGVYGGVEGRIVPDFCISLPTPLGESWLVKNASVDFDFKIEITPVTIKPAYVITFTPLPFLVFSSGIEFGTGWNLFGLQGMALYNPETWTYSDLKAYFYKTYAQGVFQFDLGAVVPGDWTHVLMMYTYQVYYQSITKAPNGDIWMWQCSGNKVNGSSNYQSLILAYGLPNDVIKRVGVMCELEGLYSSNSYKSDYSNFNGSFKNISISPLAQFQVGEKDSLNAAIGISSRRSFKEEHTDGNIEPKLTFQGREWYLYRAALSYTHKF